MKIGDIYKHKETNQLIQIECFASPMGRFESEECIIVFSHIEKNEFGVGSCPSFNGYGSVEEIEREYELLVSQEKLPDYHQNLYKIFELVEQSHDDNKENEDDSYEDDERVVTCPYCGHSIWGDYACPVCGEPLV